MVLLIRSPRRVDLPVEGGVVSLVGKLLSPLVGKLSKLLSHIEGGVVGLVEDALVAEG